MGLMGCDDYTSSLGLIVDDEDRSKMFLRTTDILLLLYTAPNSTISRFSQQYLATYKYCKKFRIRRKVRAELNEVLTRVPMCNVIMEIKPDG
jgi:hypothetical protein